MKYLHIIEYSSLVPYKIPESKGNRFSLVLQDSVIQSYVDDVKTRVMESIDYIMDDAKLSEVTVPLDNVIIYDNLDLDNEEQKLAYVFRCPVCQSVYISTNPTEDFCFICENDKFSPELVGLINVGQMEKIAVDENDVSTLIQIKDGKVVYKDEPKIEQNSDDSVSYYGNFDEEKLRERMVSL